MKSARTTILNSLGLHARPAMAFVDEIATHAESVQHHPDILIRYSRVTLSLSTHDAGGITEKDFDFAHKADALATAAGAKK